MNTPQSFFLAIPVSEVFLPSGWVVCTRRWTDKVSGCIAHITTTRDDNDPPSAKPMPVMVQTNDENDELFQLWVHEGPGTPRLVDVGDEVVIVVTRNAPQIKENVIERVYPIRDLLKNVVRPPAERLKLKRDVGKVLGIEEYWLTDDELRCEQEEQRQTFEKPGVMTPVMERDGDKHEVEQLEAPPEEVIVPDDVSSASAAPGAIPVKTVISMGDGELRKRIVSRAPVRVWTKTAGEMLQGTPVTEKELSLLPRGLKCVLRDDHGNDWHFEVKITGRGEVVRQYNQRVSREKPKVSA